MTPRPALALQLYTVRDVGLALEPLLTRVAEAGYVGVETVGTQGVAPDRLRGLLDARGLRVASSHVPLRALRDDLASTARRYRALGAPLLVVPWLEPALRPSDELGWAALGRDLAAVGRDLAWEGLALAYHHHDFELQRVGRQAGLVALLEATEPEHLQLELDTGWLTVAGEDPVAWLRTWTERVTRLHLKDLVPGGDPPWVDVGDGALPLDELLVTASNHAVEWLIVEHDAPSDPLRTIERSAAAVRARR